MINADELSRIADLRFMRHHNPPLASIEEFYPGVMAVRGSEPDTLRVVLPDLTDDAFWLAALFVVTSVPLHVRVVFARSYAELGDDLGERIAAARRRHGGRQRP